MGEKTGLYPRPAEHLPPRNNESPKIDQDTTNALRSLYGYNLGFAIEGRTKQGDIQGNIKQICHDVTSVLHDDSNNTTKTQLRDKVQASLTETNLREIVKLYSEYKNAVIHRLENPGTFSEL